MASLNFFSGLAQGFVKNQQDRLAREEKEGLRKLKEKLFKRQLDMLEEQDAAKKKVMDLFAGLQMPTQTDDLGLGQAQIGQSQKKSLTEILADPEGQMALLQSGMMKPAEILNARRTSNISAPPGMELTGVKYDTQGRPLLDFARPKFKGEVPSGDGYMIRLDEFGREISRRLMSPSERKQPEQTKGQNAVDTKFAAEAVDFKSAGGFADVQKQLAQLREASEALGKESNITGPVIGSVPEFLQKRMNPKAIAVRDAVLESVQRNLRLVLGAQFTQREGEMLLSRAYDVALPQAENKKRVDRLIKQIESAALAKQEAIEYFEENGTLTGFKGKLEWTMDDFMPADNKPSLKGPGKQEDGPIAVNPQTGERMILRNGKWQKL